MIYQNLNTMIMKQINDFMKKLQKYSEERSKKMKLVEKITSIFLSLVVLLGLISQTVFADGEGTR